MYDQLIEGFKWDKEDEIDEEREYYNKELVELQKWGFYKQLDEIFADYIL